MPSHKLRIVYMGTPDFAVLPLKRIIKAGFQVVGVVTNPDKPAGRGQQDVYKRQTFGRVTYFPFAVVYKSYN